MTTFFQSLGMTYEWAWFVATVSGVLLIALPLMLAVAMVIYVDRKVLGAVMLRRGPNVVGPLGLAAKFRRRAESVPAGNDHPSAQPIRACSCSRRSSLSPSRWPHGR